MTHVAAIKALGDRGAVRVDVNMAWSRLGATGLGLADAGCELVEQPVASAEGHGTAQVAASHRGDGRRISPAPVSAFALARDAAADVFAVKTEQSGGLRATCTTGGVLPTAAALSCSGTMLILVGTIASAHVFATFKHLQWGTELFGPLLLTGSWRKPLQCRVSNWRCPHGPGLGALPGRRARAVLPTRQKRSGLVAAAITPQPQIA